MFVGKVSVPGDVIKETASAGTIHQGNIFGEMSIGEISVGDLST